MQENLETIKKLIGSSINKYVITKYIASGSFGDVFEARNKKTNTLVALKVPKQINDDKNYQRTLLQEARIYKKISNDERGVANMKITTHHDKKIIVMDLLGPSLEKLLAKHKKFSLKTVIYLAISMLETIKHVHENGFLHRDIKPDNFVIGNENTKKLYMIDFGLSKKYLKKNGEHIDFSDTKKFCGTARYASIAAHNHQEQSRKDDLESIGYILVYLYKGKLPWQGIKHKDKKQRYKLICKSKEQLTEEELCSNMPKEFCVFLKYVRNLDFDEKPLYSALKNMFVRLYNSRNYTTDKLEWE